MTIVNLIPTLPRNPRVPFVWRDHDRIRRIVWHHTAGPDTQTPTAIALYHIRPRPGAPLGWSGIAYHYLIYQSGIIYKVRPIGVIPACVAGANTESVCVCFVGRYDRNRPSAAAIASGVWLTDVLRQAYPRIVAVNGHREVGTTATDCPGRFLYAALNATRAAQGWAA